MGKTVDLRAVRAIELGRCQANSRPGAIASGEADPAIVADCIGIFSEQTHTRFLWGVSRRIEIQVGIEKKLGMWVQDERDYRHPFPGVDHPNVDRRLVVLIFGTLKIVIQERCGRGVILQQDHYMCTGYRVPT